MGMLPAFDAKNLEFWTKSGVQQQRARENIYNASGVFQLSSIFRRIYSLRVCVFATCLRAGQYQRRMKSLANSRTSAILPPSSRAGYMQYYKRRPTIRTVSSFTPDKPILHFQNSHFHIKIHIFTVKKCCNCFKICEINGLHAIAMWTWKIKMTHIPGARFTNHR